MLAGIFSACKQHDLGVLLTLGMLPTLASCVFCCAATHMLPELHNRVCIESAKQRSSAEKHLGNVQWRGLVAVLHSMHGVGSVLPPLL